MKRFLKNTFIFLLPVFMFCAFIFFIALKSGEFMHTSQVVQKTMQGEVHLFGLAFRYEDFEYKHAMASEKKAEVLVLGTSRSMQLRKEFFETDSFYNAGGSLPFLPQAYNFLSKMPKESLPQKLILVLDQNLFNAATYEEDEQRDTSDYEFKPITINDYYTVFRQTIDAFGKGKINIESMLKANGQSVGIAAVQRQAGFYEDGSYSNGNDVIYANNQPLENVQDVLWRIDNNTNHFEHSSEISELAVKEIEKLLQFCAENNIQVTAFLPPYAPTVNEALQNSNNFEYMPKIYTSILPIFEKHNYELFDYTNLNETKDEMYIDGFHGSDRVYALICAKLAESSENLENILNEKYLLSLFNAQGNPLTVEF